MADKFQNHQPGLESPYSSGFAITPHDSNNFAQATRGIYVGGAGDVTAVMIDGTVVLFKAPPVGTTLHIRANRVNATGTTATLLVGLF